MKLVSSNFCFYVKITTRKMSLLPHIFDSQEGHKHNKSRFYCKVCCRYFTRIREDVSINNRLVWFRQWVEHGHTIEYISRRSGYSERALKRYFYDYLKNHPSWHIRRALPDLFHYLDNLDIPKSTNAMESFFGQLKTNLRQHRGLSREHFKNYIKWYLFFKNNRDKYKKD